MIYGTWEWREEISLFDYEDLVYHPRQEPFIVYVFTESDSVLISSVQMSPMDTTKGPFILSESDSTISINYSTWQVFGFSDDTLDIRAEGRHGPFGRKLIKVR